MLNNELKKQWLGVVEAMKQFERFYALDDNHAVNVRLDAGLYFEPERITACLEIYQRVEEKRGDLVEVEWDCIEMDALPARLLGRIAEFKALVEKWNTDELAELPPSTCPDFLAPQRERRNERRRLRRRC